jgi:hypothetical protein
MAGLIRMVGKSKTKRAVVAGFTILGCLFILFFGLRAFHAFKKFGGPPPPQRTPGEVETDVERIRDWMTVPFIARMYGVPEDILFDALEIPVEGNRRKSLEDINRIYFPQSDGLPEQIIKAAILAHQPPPTPVPPLTAVPPLTPIPPALP